MKLIGKNSFYRDNFNMVRILCVVVCNVLLLSSTAMAADYYVKKSGSAGGSGTTWATAKATINGAMALATSTGDKVHVAAGTYTENVSFPSANYIQLLGGYAAIGEGTQDPWVNTTTIDGSSSSGSVIYVPGNVTTSPQRGYMGIVIDGFTIQNGTDSSMYGAGGIKSYSVDLTIKRCIVQNNSGTTNAYAGGIYVMAFMGDYASKVLRIQECIIRNNSGPGAGALFVDPIGTPGVELTNTIIFGNNATATGSSWSYSCGGIIIGSGSGDPSSTNITNCTIANNTSAHASNPIGGLVVNSAYGSYPVNVTNSIIWHTGLDDISDYFGSGVITISYSDIEDTGDTGTGVIHTNPAFTGASDYHLTSISGGCINGGIAGSTPSNDLEGTLRDGYDMGAYEYAAIPEPDIAVTGSTDFGDVEEGSTSDAVVTISNQGTSALNIGTIGAVDSLSAPFTIEEDNCSDEAIAVGGNCTLTVRFSPATTGGSIDSFDIPSDDPDENPVTVNVNGNGTSIPVPDINVTGSAVFGSVEEDTSSDAIITISNQGTSELNIGTIGAVDSLGAPFTIELDNCSDETIAVDGNCTLTVRFSPTTTGPFSDSFDIPSNDPDENPVTTSVSGTGIPEGVPDITIMDSISPDSDHMIIFDETAGNTISNALLTITNDGDAPLTIGTIPAPSTPFDIISDNCSDKILDQEESCTLSVRFMPTVSGNFTDSFNIPSDDPDENPVSISVSGAKSADDDGITDDEEDGGPNNGDGNNDLQSDKDQDYVTSFKIYDDSEYVTIESPDTTALSDVAAIDNPSPADSPQGAEFPVGLFEFTVNDVTIGGSISVKIILPEGQTADTYYKYGPTPDNAALHWYEFMYDGTTGAEIEGNIITLHFVDGMRGDDTLTENGIIEDDGGPVITPIQSGSMGANNSNDGGGCFIGTAF